MADETRRIRPADLQADKDGFAALLKFEDYTPSNKEYTVAKVQAAQDAMDEAQKLEAQKDAEAKAARDAATQAEWAFHNAMLGVKKQVGAQYGEDSDELQSIGLKKKSEYKRPARRPKASTDTK